MSSGYSMKLSKSLINLGITEKLKIEERRNTMQNTLGIYELDLLLDLMRDVVEVKASGDTGDAPLIDGWITFKWGSSYLLWGQVSGHPLGIKENVRTSPLIYIDPERGIARTRSRWYRLGTPLRSQKKNTSKEALVFGPDSVEAPVEEAITSTHRLPELILKEVQRCSDKKRIAMASELLNQLAD